VPSYHGNRFNLLFRQLSGGLYLFSVGHTAKGRRAIPGRRGRFLIVLVVVVVVVVLGLLMGKKPRTKSRKSQCTLPDYCYFQNLVHAAAATSIARLRCC
jgi:hypothetical protein